MTYLIYGILSVITLGLAIYAGRLLLQLKRRRSAGIEGEKYLEKMNQDRHQERIESIITISLALTQQQCDPAEACIRVKKLLEYYPDIARQDEYQVIEQMYQEVKDFDILEDRQALSKQEKFTQDNQRFLIEDKYKESLKVALSKLEIEMKKLRGTHYQFEQFARHITKR